MSSSSTLDKNVVSHESYAIGNVEVAGDGDEFVILGNKKYYRHELMTAFAGRLQPERLAPPPVHQFGNAAALGLASFALTNFVSGMYLLEVKGITVSNMVVGLAIFYGGFVETAAGLWEMFMGNTFAATTLISFGLGFWISYGTMEVEAFGILTAYSSDLDQLYNAIGLYLVAWGIFTAMIFTLTLKSTYAFMGLFLSITLLFFLLAGYYFTFKMPLRRAAGVLCIISSCCGWYCAFAGIANKQNSYFVPKAFPLPTFGKKVQ